MTRVESAISELESHLVDVERREAELHAEATRVRAALNMLRYIGDPAVPLNADSADSAFDLMIAIFREDPDRQWAAAEMR